MHSVASRRIKIVNCSGHALCYHVRGPGKLDVPDSGLVEGGGPLVPGEEMELSIETLVVEVHSRPDRMKYVRNGYDVRTGAKV